jgi:hypothetical protein
VICSGGERVALQSAPPQGTSSANRSPTDDKQAPTTHLGAAFCDLLTTLHTPFAYRYSLLYCICSTFPQLPCDIERDCRLCSCPPRMASPASSRSPPSPSASFYDLSDDEEGEYNTIRHTSSGKGVKLLYTKSKVSRALLSPQRMARRLICPRSTCTQHPHPKTISPAL